MAGGARAIVLTLPFLSSVRTLGDGGVGKAAGEDGDEDAVSWVQNMRKKEEAKRMAENKVRRQSISHTWQIICWLLLTNSPLRDNLGFG